MCVWGVLITSLFNGLIIAAKLFWKLVVIDFFLIPSLSVFTELFTYL